MKASRYNLWVECEGSGDSILYNTLYGSLTIFGPGETPVARRILAEPAHANAQPEIVETLESQRYLVPDKLDELGILRTRKTAGVSDENRLDLIVMPTLDCNFACAYCYETRRPGTMNDETETALRLWISRELPRHKLLLLHWFGGEPLLAFDRILSISRHANEVASACDTKCVTNLTTNGYLLSPARAGKLIGCGIRNFQITLDGPPETHNALRVLRSGRGTFNRLFNNVVSLAHADPEVKISLRINFNQSNLHSIPRLLELFPEDARSRLRVVYEPIFGTCSLNAVDNIPAGEISRAVAQYYRLAQDLGYDVVFGPSLLQPGKLVYCYAERENQLIINYNGDVYKCSVSDFQPNERVGFLRSDGTLVRDSKRWLQWAGSEHFESQCYDCVYLPLCMGGCRKMRLQSGNTGSICSLVPTNASHLLKQIALGGFQDVIRRETWRVARPEEPASSLTVMGG